MTATSSAQGADIVVEPNEVHGLKRVTVRGELQIGDEDRFKNAVFNLDHGLVVFDSPGGELRAGIAIGEAIHLAKFETAVDDNGVCASACGIAWLGGIKKYLYGSGHVGFHAAYMRDSLGQSRETGSGNALVGAYLNKLGLTSVAIEFLTEKPPEEINWLTPEIAKLLGIEVTFAIPESSVNIAVLGNLAPEGLPTTSVRIQPAEPMTNAGSSTEIVTSPIALPSNQTSSSPTEQFVVLQNRDVYGDDMGHITKAANAEQCQLRCTLTESCLAFTYNEKGNYCFLKSQATRVWWAQGNVSGYRRSLESKINFYSLILKPSSTLAGEEYNFYLNSKTEECASICSGQHDCAGFTFSRHEQGRCSLKKGELTFQPQKSVIAGVKTSKSSKP